MVVEALAASQPAWMDSPLHAPTFRVVDASGDEYAVQLFPGYGRWGAAITEALRRHGAPLAEAADAIISEYTPASDTSPASEELLIAIEFCGALPAGNNAWQRCGRSYSYAITGVPYLYISELGGYELAADRTLKNPRFPNPLVPFAYVTQSQLSDTFALPVYEPSPSIDKAMRTAFESVFGWDRALSLLRSVVQRTDTSQAVMRLVDTGLAATIEIAQRRRSPGTLDSDTWTELFALRGVDRLRHLSNLAAPWAKRLSIPITETFRSLLDMLNQEAVSAGSSDMPFCVIPQARRAVVADRLRALYGSHDEVDDQFLGWIGETSEPLVVVLVAGFKPRGDDSRPDRGLLPLVRMLFGEESDVLSVVYGPGKAGMWKTYRQAPEQLEQSNGLWQAILRLSNGVLVDSLTAPSPNGRVLMRERTQPGQRPAVEIHAASTDPKFSEHDVDTVIKMLASTDDQSIFEGLCNPPGGDWSGISLVDEASQMEYRWTSLPRVSGHDGKRPDHVLQFTALGDPNVVLSIESKDRHQDFENDIGPRLVKYLNDLLDTPSTISRRVPDGEWEHNSAMAPMDLDVVSAGAFVYPGALDAVVSAARLNELDVTIAVSFVDEDSARVIIVHSAGAEGVVAALARSADQLGSRVVVEVHALENLI